MYKRKNQHCNTHTSTGSLATNDELQKTERTSTITVEVALKVKRYDVTNGQLANEIDCDTKMTKADSGRCGCTDENFNVTIEPSGEDCPRMFINQYSKSTKADAGKQSNTN